MEKPRSLDKALKITAAVIIMAFAILILACIENNLHSTMRPVPPFIDVSNQGVTVSDGNYNISYSIKAHQSTTIDKILVKSRNISDPSSCIEVKETMVLEKIGYDLDSGSIIEVNAIIPCAKVLSNETSITIVSLEPYSYNYLTTILA